MLLSLRLISRHRIELHGMNAVEDALVYVRRLLFHPPDQLLDFLPF